MLNLFQIEQLIHNYQDPVTLMTLGEVKAKLDIDLDKQILNIVITLGYPAKSYLHDMQSDLVNILRGQLRVEVIVEVKSKIIKHRVQQGVAALKDIKNIIAVASGKGGVGKSTTSVNLALSLAAEGAIVGLLDADIYGPSQPRMLGIAQRPESGDGKSIEPIESYGIQSMSIGYLIDEEEPMIWRGPMVTQALQQMLSDTNWRELDYLVIDLPPGTGDIQLTLSQKVPVSGSVIITTPQDISLLDARKALKMFGKVKVPVLGIIENMSTHICNQCGYEEHLFGSGGGDEMSDQYGVKLLGKVPLDIEIRKGSDGGHPTVINDPGSNIAHVYRAIASRTASQLAIQSESFTTILPNVFVKND
ncbi:MAG: iron-sulfur cluster carrier protein ApbC [Piscirickettsiaceae bacterium]|nr:iron-sulfur cluster carrier protein ApbC [Piscirickettsiaceae bacterium]